MVCDKDKEAVISTCPSTLSYGHFFFTKALICTWDVTSPRDVSRIRRVHSLRGKSHSFHHCCTFYIFTFKSLHENGIFDSRQFQPKLRILVLLLLFAPHYYPNIIIAVNDTVTYFAFKIICHFSPEISHNTPQTKFFRRKNGKHLSLIPCCHTRQRILENAKAVFIPCPFYYSKLRP